jgi:hypothetical protein
VTPAHRRVPIPLNDHSGGSLEVEAARVFDALLADLEAGRPVAPEALLAAHPHLAHHLRACLSLLEWTDRVAEGLEVPIGVLLGEFRLVREIGRGGMGIVY